MGVARDSAGREVYTDAVDTGLGTAAAPITTQPAQNSYVLANNIAIAAAGNSTPVINVMRGVYVYDAQFTGTGPLILQSLGADGVTWRDVASLTNPGTFAGEVRVGANAQVRVKATNALTAVSASLS